MANEERLAESLNCVIRQLDDLKSVTHLPVRQLCDGVHSPTCEHVDETGADTKEMTFKLNYSNFEDFVEGVSVVKATELDAGEGVSVEGLQ
jgi:hypothetical protein